MSKPGIANRNKWIEKTLVVMRHDMNTKPGIPIAFAIATYNPEAAKEERFGFRIRTAMDPHHPISPKDDPAFREKLEMAMEFIMQGVARIFDSEAEDDFCRFVPFEGLH